MDRQIKFYWPESIWWRAMPTQPRKTLEIQNNLFFVGVWWHFIDKKWQFIYSGINTHSHGLLYAHIAKIKFYSICPTFRKIFWSIISIIEWHPLAHFTYSSFALFTLLYIECTGRIVLLLLVLLHFRRSKIGNWLAETNIADTNEWNKLSAKRAQTLCSRSYANYALDIIVYGITFIDFDTHDKITVENIIWKWQSHNDANN